MEYLEKHPWRQLILTPIVKDISLDISDTNPQWELLDGEMVKLGSLEHELFDIAEMQRIALSLLSTETKDLRVFTHLLRTLQHSGVILDLLLGLQLLCDYTEHYWAITAPTSELKKYRLGVQIIKRFDKNKLFFQQNASRLEKEEAKKLLKKLITLFQGNKLEIEFQQLSHDYLNHLDSVAEKRSEPASSEPVSSSSGNSMAELSVIAKPIEIDSSNERAWKNTLSKVVDYLLEKDISTPVAYQLRRYIIWNNITSLPLYEGNQTSLLPPSIDRVVEYEQSLDQPNLETWKEIEHSLTLSPYWFYGHYLSAQLASKLGYEQISLAIKQCLIDFIARLPKLAELCFNDGTEFCPQIVLEWIYFSSEKVINSSITNYADYEDEDTLESVLGKFNSILSKDLRDRFYNQISLAQLLEQRGFDNIAEQSYLAIYNGIKQLSVIEWENSLTELLELKLRLK